MRFQSVSVLGCGWLGLPLAKKLAASGYKVKGSTTTPAKISVLENSNIIPYHLTCDPSVEGENVADFFKADALFLNIPFRRDLKDPKYYAEQIRSVAQHAAAGGIRLVIFAGSTLVYPALNQTAREADVIAPADERAKVLLDVEQMLLSDRRFTTTVIRFAGLYGPDREIGNFFKTARVPKDGDAPVNLIHLDDCIGIVQAVLEKNAGGEVFNACGDDHPLRKDLYTKAAIAAGTKPLVFESAVAGRYKIIANTKVKERLGYRFKYPSPLDWINRAHGA
jgi:nucleoside-diphosphate-sugar epimerase